MNAPVSTMPDSARALSGGPGQNREGEGPKQKRAAVRLPSARVPSITGVRVSPHNTNALLVNISASGVLVDCDRRIVPGSKVTVQFAGTFEPASVAGQVVRCAVAGIGGDGGVRYHVGIAFFKPIPLDDALDPEAPRHQEPYPGPVPVPVPVPASVSPAPALRNRW